MLLLQTFNKTIIQKKKFLLLNKFNDEMQFPMFETGYFCKD